MKIAILCDSHCGARNDSQIINDYFLKFYNETFFPYIEEQGIDTLIHLGDVFDRRKYVNYKTLNSWRVNVFDRLSKLNVDSHFLVGNHDTYFKNTNEINSLTEILKEYPAFHIYENPCEVSFVGEKLLFVPWVNQSNEHIINDLLENSDAPTVMGHLEIRGFEICKGVVNFDKGFDLSRFTRFEKVFSGHFHNKHNHNNVWYFGAPYEINWNDYMLPRGFHVYDLKKKEIEFIQNPNRLFYKLDYEDLNKSYESVVVEPNFSQFKDVYVKVVIKNKTNQHWFEQFIENLYKANPADVSIVELNYDDADDMSVDETKDTLSILIDYVAGMKIENNADELIETLRNLYNEAMDSEVVVS